MSATAKTGMRKTKVTGSAERIRQTGDPEQLDVAGSERAQGVRIRRWADRDGAEGEPEYEVCGSGDEQEKRGGRHVRAGSR